MNRVQFLFFFCFNKQDTIDVYFSHYLDVIWMSNESHFNAG